MNSTKLLPNEISRNKHRETRTMQVNKRKEIQSRTVQGHTSKSKAWLNRFKNAAASKLCDM